MKKTKNKFKANIKVNMQNKKIMNKINSQNKVKIFNKLMN